MSGHSKWSTIKHQKGVKDARRGALFTKLGNAITIAAKEGGGDPDMNFRLRLAIDKAKQSNLPNDNIERAIKRGTGELSDGTIDAVVYEGFGPEGIAVIIEALTDNRNRTVANVKHLFSKHGGSLGGPNAVSWMFDHRGVIETDSVSEELELELIEQGIVDIQRDGTATTIITEITDLQKVQSFLQSRNQKIDRAAIEYVPKEEKTIDTATAQKVEKFFDALDEDADVNNIYTNASFPES